MLAALHPVLAGSLYVGAYLLAVALVAGALIGVYTLLWSAVSVGDEPDTPSGCFALWSLLATAIPAPYLVFRALGYEPGFLDLPLETVVAWQLGTAAWGLLYSGLTLVLRMVWEWIEGSDPEDDLLGIVLSLAVLAGSAGATYALRPRVQSWLAEPLVALVNETDEATSPAETDSEVQRLQKKLANVEDLTIGELKSEFERAVEFLGELEQDVREREVHLDRLREQARTEREKLEEVRQLADEEQDGFAKLQERMNQEMDDLIARFTLQASRESAKYFWLGAMISAILTVAPLVWMRLHRRGEVREPAGEQANEKAVPEAE